jgi:hypothetical protein
LHIKYDGKVVTAIELLNIVKKIEDDPGEAYVRFPNYSNVIAESPSGGARLAEKLKYCIENNLHGYNYQKKYIGSVTIDSAGKVKINFSEVT